MVKWSRYRPGVAQTVGRGISLLFHDRGTRTGWVVSSTPRPHFTPGKDLVPILHEARWAPGPVWTGGKSRPHRYLIPDCPAPSQSLYRLSCPAHNLQTVLLVMWEVLTRLQYFYSCFIILKRYINTQRKPSFCFRRYKLTEPRSICLERPSAVQYISGLLWDSKFHYRV